MKNRILLRGAELIFAVCLLLSAGKLFGSNPPDVSRLPIKAPPSWLRIDPEAKQSLGLIYEPVEIKIPGLKKEYKFIWISDLHVMADDVSEIEDKWKGAMIYRRDKRFNNPQSGLTPAAVWEKLPAILNGSNADALFFGGDICDTGSAANLTFLKSGFKQLTKPFIYLKEDHDISPWHLISRDSSKQHAIAKEIDGYPSVHCLEFDHLMVVGVSYSVAQFKPSAVKRFKELYRKAKETEKSVILLLHVPVSPENDPVLSKDHFWGGKIKAVNSASKEFMNLIKAKDSPVKAILCGHIHRSWDGMVTPILYQHVFEPTFKGNIGIITVKPAQKP